MEEKKIKIRLFGKPEVTLEREAREGETVKSETVELGVEWPTLALFILWRHRGDVDADTLVDVLKPRSKAETDRNSFIKKHKTTLRQRLNLELPETLKLTALGPAILEQAWVDVVDFDAKIGGSHQELEEAITLRRRGRLLANLTEPDVFIKEREAREEKYREALWQLFQANSGPDPEEAVRFAKLLLECEGLPEDRKAFLQEQIRKLEHQLFQLKSGAEAEKTTRPQRLPALPNFPTELIGREAEIARIAEILTNPGLVTLTGTAGIGKTRVAAAVARRLAENLPDGAVWVDLTAASDAEQTVQQVSAALGLREEPARPVRETLTAFLEDKTLLLVWDNCEHLADACAALANNILSRCPFLRLLATSREWLRAYGERLHEVSLLPSDSAVRLFLARAQAVQPKFQITEQNQPALLKICQDLDGLPLALELAAARMDMHDVFWIAENLHRRFELLTDGPRAGLPRHASLQVSFDFSYDLLPPVEQALFRALGVFVGSFRADAAEAVAALPDTETLLRQLVRKSLVLRVDAEEEPRFRLLASVQQYAEQHLEAHGEADTARRRHREFFLALAEEAEPELRGANQKQWLDRLETEVNNLRAALSSCESNSEWNKEEAAKRAETYLHLSGLLLPLWQMRGHLTEGRNQLDEALRQCEEVERKAPIPALAAAKGEALWAAGVLALYQSDYGISQVLSEKSLAIRQELGDTKGIASCFNSLGSVAAEMGKGTAAIALYKESLSIRRQIGDQQAIAGSLNNLGLALRDQGDFGEAKVCLEESLTIRQRSGNPESIASSLHNLGSLALFQGIYTEGGVLLKESLTIYRQLQDQHGIAYTLHALGSIALMQREFGLAQKLYEECLPILQRLGDPLRVSVVCCSLSGVAIQQGDTGLARRMFREGLRVFRKIGSPVGMVSGLEGYSAVTNAENQLSVTAKLIGAAQAYRLALELPLPPAEQQEASIQLAEVQEAMGMKALEAALAEGRAMSWEQAVAFALGEDAP